MMNKKKNKIKKIVFTLLILIILLISSGLFYFMNSLKATSNQEEIVNFNIPSGSSISSVANDLYELDLIKDKLTFRIYAKLNNLENIKKGEYELKTTWDVKEILTYITSDKTAISNDVTITLIEGDWCKHIASKISEKTNVTADELLALWNDTEFIKEIQSDYPFLTDDLFNDQLRYKLEGYLFPNTYNFKAETTAKEVTLKLLDQTLKIYNKYLNEINQSEFSVHEIFTLASIVQYEAGGQEDMKNIAQVFINRLHEKMLLGSSVTVCYAMDIDKDDDWKTCERNPGVDSPYNTYKYAGIPIGPILNPSEQAIEAVLNPTANDYLYFMADVYGDGTVYYAKTYAEHQANVEKYLKP